MVAVYEATSGNADTSRQAAILDAPDTTYSLLYFDTQGICNPIRNLLSMGNATWKQLYPQDWENEDKLDKTSTPFEVTPVLYVHAKDGSETKVPKWIRIHEEHLRANGSNGHYVGDQVSLADLRSADMVDMILRFPMAGETISQETAPGLLKVKAAVDTHPAIVQWRDSELFKSLRPSRAHPPRPRAACAGLNDRKGNKQGP
ncbi:hypothetical protein BGW38_002724 [Lunasporangiospora selenospora]|uniref:Glutathione S-transferase C-terminal domain-containing protein n=1 Tax=Lunasporangiospora selenospora TaxID=979761 RepID=A0A9P6G1J1_9FUNG|nr:hypothetical protein BGW38_002724 [Lunasporangiospora selenospora]